MDRKLKIEILSFAYKSNSIPRANLVFDVRFIDNPYWVEELRSLTGLEQKVQDFVLKQNVAQDFLAAFKEIAKVCIIAHIDSLAEKSGKTLELDDVYTIAFGCTGGQHRSVAMVEEAASLINELFPQYAINIYHREINERRNFLSPGDEQVVNTEARR
jgi:RNase adapter protein RapZ